MNINGTLDRLGICAKLFGFKSMHDRLGICTQSIFGESEWLEPEL